MKSNASSRQIIVISLAIILMTSACQPVQEATPMPTPCPTPSASPAPTLPPATRAAPTPRPSPTPDYQKNFAESLPADSGSCHPDGTTDDIGVYIYDLKEEREIISINADVPFQYASAFKAPVLLYFLSSCRQYWDPASPEWEAYFQDPQAAKNVDLFTSLEYERIVAEFISKPANWNRTDAFFSEHRQVVNGANGEIDTRYFVLEKVHSMIAQSSNTATADLLKFIYLNCPVQEQTQAQIACGGPNAITSFNAWFNEFTGIKYEDGEARRGLYSWDTVIQNGKDGSQEIPLSTLGLKDTCANQTAVLNCDPAYTAFNTLTARDLFTFYHTLYNLQDESLRETAFSLLKLDEPGPARGYLKNMARGMQAISLSKNGHAFFTNGSINADAGILLYKGKAYIVVTLAFNAVGTVTLLYGSYDEDGNLVSTPGLIQNLLESYTITP
jgi:hypothetical protein